MTTKLTSPVQQVVQLGSSPQENSPPTTIRLHVTPFTPQLLSIYLSAAARDKATDVSYHTTETFPDKPFGFVTLPVMEAANLRKKLNGSIIKGSKVRIEEARPEGSLKRKSDNADDVEEDADDKEKKRARKKEKKSKGDTNVIDGYELPEDRKVKRGWTESETKKPKKDKKKAEKSLYGKDSELLFRTKLPKNMVDAADNEEPDAPGKEKKSKKKKDKEGKKSSRKVLVHEFENTTKTPSFLKKQSDDVPKRTAHEYVDGKGWVDQDGNLLDDTKPRILRDERFNPDQNEAKRKEKKKEKKSKKTKERKVSLDVTAEEEPVVEHLEESLDEAKSSQPAESEQKESEFDAVQAPHPLETLFKRPKSSAEGSIPQITVDKTDFSFFGKDDEEENEDVEMQDEEAVKPSKSFRIQIPNTPHEPRQLRSGAPTPDTAAAFKRFSFAKGVVDVDDKLSEESADEDAEDNTSNEDEDDGDEEGEPKLKEESAFTKWFWENRGDNNRTWKRRRKEAMKEKLWRENKRKGRRIA
jgi:hypothetical protein